jgi:dipeptidyl aminopeptidase/acylaminoacyl peptidase
VISIEDLLHLKFVSDPQISPDGKQVVFAVKTVDQELNRYFSHLFMVEVSSGEVRQVTHGEVSDNLPRWSPDGESIAFHRTQDKITQIWLAPVGGGEPRQLTQLEEGEIGSPQWSPGGGQIAFEFRPTHPDWTQRAKKEREERGLSDPPRIITRLRYRREGKGFLHHYQHIWSCDTQTGESRQITSGEWDDHDSAWSPDGTRIAFLSNRGDDPDTKPYQEQIWLVPPKGGEAQEIPIPEGYKRNLAWSPDGRYIAYIGYESQEDPWGTRHDHLWIVSLQGDPSRCLTRSLDRTVGNMTISDSREIGSETPLWSKDSRGLFYLLSDAGNCHLYTVDLTEEPKQVIDGSLDVCSFTGDVEGRTFASLISNPTRPAEVFIASREGTEGSSWSPLPITSMNGALLEDICLSEPEEIRFGSFDGTDVQGWLLKPPEFDPTHLASNTETHFFTSFRSSPRKAT